MREDRFICIHGHFYQPPRENPWLESVEVQDSAQPYHDWNERITAECYAANGASRMLDAQGRVKDIVNNYAHISFNVGPTLLSWMQGAAPEAYRQILVADRESQRHFGGHGSALAQAYNHVILPLASRRDKRTQVHWGIRDFQYRFGRFPEGLWLPETAVDLETLDVVAQAGIAFVILAPSQAARVRPRGGTTWHDVTGGRVDGTRPYEVALPSGKRLVVFFYDGPISRAVAFEKLLDNGEVLAQRLAGAFRADRDGPQLVHIATDGETYGHHHRFGDMALAYALQHITQQGLARLTNYGEYLALNPPTDEAEIWDNSSWSCVHGVERWRADCGCNSGGRPGWNQSWRGPLRDALEVLRDSVEEPFVRAAGELLKEPWAARDDFVEVILDRSEASVQRFLRRHARRRLDAAGITRVLKLMELQRHAMLMFTSCGWFFDDVSGIETVQVLHYAARVVQLAQEVLSLRLEEPFLHGLERAKSNVPELGDGRKIFERWVRPAVLDLVRVGAHYAVHSLFSPTEDTTRVHAYVVQRQDHRLLPAGRARLSLGRATVMSEVTRESQELSYAVLHLGDHNLAGGVRPYPGPDAYAAVVKELTETFARADILELFRVVDRHFRSGTYSLSLLFRDEQRHVITQILQSSLAEADALYQQMYEQHAPLLQFLAQLGVAPPRELSATGEHALGARLLRAARGPVPNLGEVRAILEEARRTGIQVDASRSGAELQQCAERLSQHVHSAPEDLASLRLLADLLLVLADKPFERVPWSVQNAVFDLARRHGGVIRACAAAGDASAQTWWDHFQVAAQALRLAVP